MNPLLHTLAAAVASVKLALVDIRTPPEWRETGIASGAGPGWTKRGLPLETCATLC